jgi:SpoVK/Ycf46/Vps4 family AAA+-type ATPase
MFNQLKTHHQSESSYIHESPQKRCSSHYAPYKDRHEHLFDELRWLARLLTAQVIQQRSVHFYDTIKGFRDFFIADEEIDALISSGIFDEKQQQPDDNESKKYEKHLLQQAHCIRKDIQERVKATISQNKYLPLIQLSRLFHLNEFEQRVLIICLAPQIDARYEKLYAYLQNNISKEAPTVDFILNLLCQSPGERLNYLSYFHPSSALKYFFILHALNKDSDNSRVSELLRVDQTIVDYVCGSNVVAQRLLPFMDFQEPLSWKDVAVCHQLKDKLHSLFCPLKERGRDYRPIYYFYGPQGVGKKTLARALCTDLHITLASVDISLLAHKPETFIDNVRLILREGLLRPCALYFDHIEKLKAGSNDTHVLFNHFIKEIQKLGWILFLGSTTSLPFIMHTIPSVYEIEIPAPDYAVQNTLWEMYLKRIGSGVHQINYEQISSRFSLTGKQINRAVHLAHKTSCVRSPGSPQIMLNDILASCRIQSQPRLSRLARKIIPLFYWNDLVLPETQMAQLRELTSHVKNRHIVMDEWGFNQKLSLGRGVNALFAGPSGTGKTMAAEVIAHELGLDLYKIDLSSVVSKYIGETEKNLNHIFTEAKHSNAILFFDEADALFGKRSEVKDAHDRYANIEIGYLLQEMEEYDGVAILATNLRKNMDEAFVRRLRFIVLFPFPDEQSRLGIWERVFPDQVSLDQAITLSLLARKLNLTGGNIKNIALTAAFFAVEDGGVITMNHLIKAAQREYQKLGRIWDEKQWSKVR